MKTHIYLWSICWMLLGCRERHVGDSKQCAIIKSFKPTYAKGFAIDYYSGFKVISTFSGSKLDTRYIIYSISKKCPKGFEDAVLIPDSIYAICLLSTSQIAATSALKQVDKIKAVANPDFIFDSTVQAKIKNQEILSIGKDYQPDIEKLVRLKPQLLFTDGEYATQSAVREKLLFVGIQLIRCQDYKENSPLARAEWLYFYGAIFNQELLADSLFKLVEKNYLIIKSKLSSVTQKPTVFCNFPYQGVWYLPAKGNYNSQLFADAGAEYLWAKTVANNGFNLSLNFESVYKIAQNAQLWILFSAENTLKELAAKDAKLSFFESFKKEAVYSVAKRSTNGGGVDYWESGVFRPDYVLHDLGLIFHPSLFVGDSTIYFKRLAP